MKRYSAAHIPETRKIQLLASHRPSSRLPPAATFAALPLLLHPLVDRVGLGHGLREAAVGIVHDQRGITRASCHRCGRDEGRGRVHLVIEAAVALAAAAIVGAEEDETRVDDSIARTVDGNR